MEFIGVKFGHCLFRFESTGRIAIGARVFDCYATAIDWCRLNSK